MDTQKKYRVTLVLTKYYEASVEVEATDEEEAARLADDSDVPEQDWRLTDEEVEVSEGDDAVIEVE